MRALLRCPASRLTSPLFLLLVAVALISACRPPAKPEVVCGGITGKPCPTGQVCDLPAGQCQGADLTGRCVDVPEVCAEIFKPVCGCDGKTYSNDCERLKAGVQKNHDGECRS